MSDYNIGSETWPGLSKLIEEMGEVSQVVGKLIGSGGEPNHWDGSDLVDELHDELADLQAALTFVIAINGRLDGGRIDRRMRSKLLQYFEWHDQQPPLPGGGSC